MLIFATTLEINETLTKEKFVNLVIKWNKGSTDKNFVIDGMTWNGEPSIRFGSDRCWLDIQQLERESIVAVRYECTTEDGVVWNTDFVVNFTEQKLAILLERSYLEEALTVSADYAAPYFITMLENEGFLKSDAGIPVSSKPVEIEESNFSLLSEMVKREAAFSLPVVYIPMKEDGKLAADKQRLSWALKGAAHVVYAKDMETERKIRELFSSSDECSVRILFPNPSAKTVSIRVFPDPGSERLIMGRTIQYVTGYMVSLLVDRKYTWQGVVSAAFEERWQKGNAQLTEAEERAASSESARKKAEEEAEEASLLVESTDEEIAGFRRQIEALARENERLRAENQGMQVKLMNRSEVPVLFYGNEKDIFPGEIKDILLYALNDYAGREGHIRLRRGDVIRDIIEKNQYENLLKKRADDLKGKLWDYSGMTSVIRSFLVNFGFEIGDDGKHCKLSYGGDPRYHATLSKTPSDTRGTRNTARDIIRDLL